MDRQIVYPGAIPLETDLLYTNKYAMIGLAKLSASLMGTNTYIRGLACTPSSPASLVINIAPGEIYSLQNIDGTAYSSLNADVTNSILKQGIVLSATQFTLAAPTTSGQSINYLIQVTYSDVDSGATVLPYYNAANPSVAYSGPAGSGAAQNTVRAGVCVIAVKTGVSAATGTQVTPSPDTGYTPAWVVTVAQGATSITAANISIAPAAPFIPSTGLVDSIQKKTLTHGTDIGVANACTVNYTPAVLLLTDGMELSFKVNNTNTGATTFSPNGTTGYPIVRTGGTTLTGGEIIAGGTATLKWNSSTSSWVLINSTGSGAALANLGIGSNVAKGWFLGEQTFTSSGTYTPTPGTRLIRVTVTGGGGSGGGCQGTTTSQTISGAGGGAGGTAVKTMTITAGATFPVIVGAGGAAVSGANPGKSGGNSSFNGTVIGVGGGFAAYNSITSTSGGAPGTASGGDRLYPGGYGSDGQNGQFLMQGNGGASIYGGGGRGGSGGGLTGLAPGSGGGGAYDGALTGTAYSSGAGAKGIVVIEEFA